MFLSILLVFTALVSAFAADEPAEDSNSSCIQQTESGVRALIFPYLNSVVDWSMCSQFLHVESYMLVKPGTLCKDILAAIPQRYREDISISVTHSGGTALENKDAVITGDMLVSGATSGDGLLYTFGVAGDVDADGVVTAADARLTLRCAVELESFRGLQKVVGDLTIDRRITAADARKILRMAVGL